MSRRLARRPCGSCPYRRDVPSGVWSAREYDKLPGFDLPTGDQPPYAFFCHLNNGKLCAGWVGCHDMEESMGLRLLLSFGTVTQEEYVEALHYVSPVELWATGAEAAEHGKRDELNPSEQACKVVFKLKRAVSGAD